MKLYEKLFEIHKKVKSIKKDSAWYNYTYASLWQVLEWIEKELEDNKILALHKVVEQKVVTKLVDTETWEFEESAIDIWSVESEKIEKYEKDWKQITSTEKNSHDPQWVGSIITYYRRYNLVALLNLEIEDDDWAGWSTKDKNKKWAEKKWSPYECTKCWKVDKNANVFQWKFWPCFKCNLCGEYSKDTKPVHEDDWTDFSKQDF